MREVKEKIDEQKKESTIDSKKYNKMCLSCYNDCKWLLTDGILMACPFHNKPKPVSKVSTDVKKTRKKRGEISTVSTDSSRGNSSKRTKSQKTNKK